MFRRQSSTILLLTAERIVRADFSGGRLTVLRQQPRPDADDLAMLVDSALRLGGKCRRTVWVLTTDVWVQAVPLESGATRGVSATELTQALAFEAESLSGIGAFESVLAHRSLESDGFHRHFWVVQMPLWQLEQVDEAIGEHGGRLGGITHPAGLPRAVGSQSAGSSWQRIELWPDCVAAVRSSSGKTPEVHLVNSSPAQESWKATVRMWLEANPNADQRVLLFSRPGDHLLGMGDETETVDLNDEASLIGWLTAWNESLGFREPAVPLLQPAAAPLSVQSRLVMSAAVAALVAAGCWAIDITSRAKLRSADEETRQLEQRAEEYAAFDGEIKRRTDQLAKRSEENRKLVAALDTYEAVADAQKRRLAVLLAGVAELRPEHLVIRRIEQDAATVTISGAHLDPNSVHDFAEQLNRRVRPLGWTVQPTPQEASKKTTSGKPWTFTMRLSNSAMTSEDLWADRNGAGEPIAGGATR
ncbi:MAG: hypothetical protein EA381_09335 [Planctomycetaceae bacterium]|nr:MAG: hypothetical protein EA381_09335 [Planctomycetaceae bacterium]